MTDLKLSAVLELKDQFTSQAKKVKNSITGIKEEAEKASKTSEKLKESLSGIKGSYSTTINVKDNATAKIAKVKTELSGFTGKSYTALVNIKTNMPTGGLNFSQKVSGVTDGILMGTSMQMAGAAGIGFGIYDTVKTYTDFQAQMSAVASISGASAKDMQKLTNKAKEMGKTTQFSASEAGKALEYMAMAGWKTDDMLNAISGIMNLAAASGEDLATVSDIVTDALTAFGLKTSDSAMFADVLEKASANSNTNVKMMGETFKYVAPIAGTLKYSVQDVAVGIGLMANAEIKGSEAGTALRSVFVRLISPPKDAVEAIAKIGLQVKNADGTIRPFRDVLKDLRTKFAGLSDAEKYK